MKLHELVEYFDAHGVQVETIAGKLSVTADDAELTDAVIAALKTFKKEVSAYYSHALPSADPSAPGGQDVHPLSFAQNRLYFLYQYDPAVTYFNLPIELALNGGFDPDLLRRSIETVLDRHKTFRTTFFVADDVPYQRYEAHRRCAVAYSDLSALPATEQQAHLAQARGALAGTPFDLGAELPVRVQLFRHAQAAFTLILVIHHIATDEWSITQLIRELSAAYRALRNGEPASAAARSPSYFDFVAWQNERFAQGGYDVARAYWKDHLGGGSGAILELPMDKPRPPAQTYRTGRITKAFPPALRARLARMATRLQLTEFTLCLGVYYLLLNRLTGQRDIVVGTDVFGRERAEFQEVGGFFVNQLALRSLIPQGISVGEYFRQVGASTKRSLRFQDMPFDRIVDELKIERDPAYSPLFQVKFLYRPALLDFGGFDGASVVDRQAFEVQSQYDLTFQVLPDSVVAYYNTDLFLSPSVDGWLDLYFSLVEAVLDADAQPVRSLLSPSLLARLQPSIAGVVKPVTGDPLRTRIADAITQVPEAIAIRTATGAISYREFGEKLGAATRYLRKLGVKRGDRVAVYLERGIDMVIAIVAVLDAGAVLVPLDTDYPIDHIDFTLSDSGASVVITNDALADGMGEFYGIRLLIDTLYQQGMTAAQLPPVESQGDDLAYLLYTSGSTGRPKGVLVRRAAFANLCDWFIDFAAIDRDSRVLLMIPIGFDAALKNIFAPLMSGATLVLSPPSVFDPRALLALIDTAQVSVVNSAPTALYAMLAEDQAQAFRSLRHMTLYAVGGEALNLELVKPWLRSEHCRTVFANIYGPTECTDISIAIKGPRQDWLDRTQVPIGRPIQNLQAFIVDDEGAPCAPGAVGELLIGGVGVAAGYNALPAETAAVFVTSELATGTLYRTGDFCRYDAAGDIVYVGRRDRQIKIRGKRVEIDAVLAELARLLPARTISLQRYARDGLEMLIGFVEGESGPTTVADIKAELSKRLPRHAVPSQILFLPSLPLTDNGKVSAGALLDLYERHRASFVDQASRPLSDTETLVAAIWTKLLSVGVSDPDTSFFSAGGDSILSIQLVAELRRQGFEISVAEVFKHPTLEQLAALCEQRPISGTGAASPSALAPFALVAEDDRAKLPEGLEDAYPLTPLQQSMLFYCLLEPESAVYHDVFSFELAFSTERAFAYDERCFAESIQKALDGNPVLRTGFAMNGYSVPLQRVHRNVDARIVHLDISSDPKHVQDEKVRSTIQAVKKQAFRLDGTSLIRFTILRKSSDRIQLIIDAHHVILDGWSLATLQRQIFEHYRHLKQGLPFSAVFESGGVRFADYVAQQLRDAQDETHRSFWNTYCAGLEGAILPGWPLKPEVAIQSITLAPDLVAALAMRIAEDSVSLKTLLLMAHAYMLGTLRAQPGDFCIGLTDNGRPEVEGAQNLMGLFLNVLPLRLAATGRSWREFGQAIERDNVESKPHRSYPLHHIVSANRALKIDSILTYNNFHVTDEIRNAEGLDVVVDQLFEETNFQIAALASGNVRSGLMVMLQVKVDLQAGQIETLLREFVFALERMASGYDSPIPLQARSALPCLAADTGQERRCELRYEGHFDAVALDEAVARAQLQWSSRFAGGGRPAARAPLGIHHRREQGRQTLSLSVPSNDGPGYGHGDELMALAADRYFAALPGAGPVSVRLRPDGEWWPLAALRSDLDTWRECFANTPDRVSLPADHARQAGSSGAVRRKPVVFTADRAAGVFRLAQGAGVSVPAVLVAGWMILASRLNRQPRVMTGVSLPASSGHDGTVETGAMPLALDLESNPAVQDVLTAVEASLAEACRHRGVPARLLRPQLPADRSDAGGAAPPVGIALHGNALMDDDADWLLSIGGNAGEASATLSYRGDRYDDAGIERIVERFAILLDGMVAEPRQRIGSLPVIADAERQLLLHTWNRTEMPYPAGRCVHELFEAQVRRNPDALAIIQNEFRLSYGDLNAQANRLARRLIAAGVKPDSRVAICVDRRPHMLVGLLAVLKAGGAYVPLDPAYPVERLVELLADAGPVLLLTDAFGRRTLGGAIPRSLIALDLDVSTPEWSLESDTNPDPRALGLAPSHPAYVIYTSGSTGKPKGVVVEHGSLVARMTGLVELYGFGPGDRILQFASLNFDLSVEEIVGSLISGAALVLRDSRWLESAEAFWRLCDENGVTVADLPTRFWETVSVNPAMKMPARVRLVIVGGEALQPAGLAAWFADGRDRPRLLNTYGPTEATVTATYHQPADAGDFTCIGRPVANTRLYVLDTHGQPVPVGAVGELTIGGAGVARGYLNRPELTAERFLDDPFCEEPGARMYRSGDLVRYRPDGGLDFLRRADHQVKIRGFRIELGEIEARLADHPSVRDAVVIAREDGEGGDKRLIAYVTPQPGAGIDVSNLRTHLGRQLPEYMVPAAFVRLDHLPLMPSGKLNRKALPAPDQSAVAVRPYEAPQGDVETTLAGIWSELLGVARVGRDDNFFELGGHSLLAVQMVERLRRAGLIVEVRALFAHPVLAALATALGSSRDIVVPANRITPGTTAITPELLPLITLQAADIERIVAKVPGGIANIQDIYALSPLQDGILFHHLLATEGDPYLLVSQMIFADRALLDRFLVAAQQVVDRHDILRTAVYWEGLATPAQVVWRRATLPVIEMPLDADGGSAGEQLARRFDPSHYRMDLTQAPLLHFAIAQQPEDGRWVLLVLQHHLTGDHSTAEFLQAEVAAILSGQGATLAPPQPFRNLIAHARLGMTPEAHEQFFREQLADIDEPTLPFGLSDVHRDGGRVVEFHRMLPQPLNDRLRAQARRAGVTLASLCHVAFGQVLARTSGRESVVFGTVLLGRMQSGEGAGHAMGLFINTLPLRLDLDGTSVRDSVRRAQRRLAGLLEHEHASLALAQRCGGVAAPAPLFSALLNYRHNRTLELTSSGTALSPFAGIEVLGEKERTNYPLSLAVEDYGHALGLTAQVVDSLPSERVCDLMQRALEHLADVLDTQPDLPVRQLDVLSRDERHRLLHALNQTQAAYPADRCVHELFEEQVRGRPDALAIVQDDVRLTYGELNAQANRLAHRLIELGVRPDSRVAICVDRRPHMVVGLLAILKAGGAYVPLDPAYPVERLIELLADAEPVLLLTDATGRRALGDSIPISLITLDLDLATPEWTTRSDINPDPRALGLTPSHLAYLIYTSGSTGKPKGAMITHSGLHNYLDWSCREYAGDKEACDSIVSSPLAFDATVTTLYIPLLTGGRLMLLPGGDEVAALEIFLRNTRHPWLIKITPAHLVVLGQQLANSWGKEADHTFIVGGEALPASTVALWQQLSPQSRLINEFGPTETVVGCSVYDTSHAAVLENISIGRPIANTRLYLLDSYGQPVPLGAIGELYIGGAGVARGYWNRPELTAERFLDDPFCDDPGARMYRSGDLARYRPDGNLDFLGRADHQVKIRGFRIELGEIEARLSAHPAVQDVVVVAREEKRGDKRLVAYVTAQAGQEIEVPDLRAHLLRQLPDYMVPAAFVRLETLPLTPNGKLDRKALPAPDQTSVVTQAYEAPQGDVEAALAAIWSELLGIGRIGRQDHFFELGGHSLLAVRLLSRLQSVFDVALPLATLFAQPTLSALARAVNEARVESLPAIVRVPRDLPMALSFAQQRLWFLSQLEGVSLTYHIPAGLRLTGALDRTALRRSLDRLLVRHEALRTVFGVFDGQPQISLLPPDCGFSLTEHDLRGVPEAPARLDRLMVEDAIAPFDLAAGPLIRGCLIRLAADEHVFLITQHHIVSDGWSMGVLADELNALYRAFASGQADPLPPLAVQYPDYAAWQRQWLSGDRLQAQADYWRTQLADAPVLLDLPTDRPRPEQQSFVGASLDVRLDAGLTRSLRRLGQQHGVTLFMILMAAWAAVLSRLSGQTDLVIGTPTANRNRQELEGLIGFFVNVLALRIDLSGGISMADLLAQVGGTALAAQDHQDLPFEQVVEIVQPPRRLAHTPLFQVVFVWQNNEQGTLDLPGLTVAPVEASVVPVKFDLELELAEAGDEIVGMLRYATALFDAETIERQRTHLMAVLKAMITDAEQPVARIDLLSEAERHQLLYDWNRPEGVPAADRRLHELFEAQAEKTPGMGDAVVESIGRTIDNTRIYLLDAHGQPVPIGAVGEIYIGGVDVPLRYPDLPELAAGQPLDDPFRHDEPNARMYRTGELAWCRPDGRLVRKRPALPDEMPEAAREYEAPQGEIEVVIAGVWSELLGIERISRHDNFFELGGHSMLAVMMVEMLRQADMNLEVTSLFEKPTLINLARATQKLETFVI